MPTEQKIDIVKQTTERFKKSSGVYFTKYTGIDVQTITNLRKSFRDNQVEYVVTKNTLTKLAAKEAGYEGMFDDILSGQIAIAYSEEDATAPARVIKDFKKENKDLLEVLGLLFEGELYPSDKYKELANLPSKEESLTKMLMMLNQPLTKLAYTLEQMKGTKLVTVLNNLKDNKN